GGRQIPSLLAVTKVLARLNFDKPEWLDILGGREVMIESPLIQELRDEFRRDSKVEDILHLLQERFGPAGPAIAAGLAQVKTDTQLLRLLLDAAHCASVQKFEERLRAELPQPPAPSTRGKRRPRKSAE